MILGTTLLDFYLVKWMYSANSKTRKNLLLTLSIIINVGLLCYFKYVNFFIENVNFLLSQVGFTNIAWVDVLLPIGISFYTFETITYVVDTYRGVHKPLTNFWDYQLYIMLFPKLIAGPIVRFHDLANQINIEDRIKTDNYSNRLIGFYRFCIGLAKKVIIANQVGAQADLIFSQTDYSSLGSSMAWIGILAYTFQIYFDFSGYSDMAIGIARMIGFRFPENFNNPYVAISITDFWRRWHISVSSWMKNYLYIPLGGNRVSSKYHLFFNLWIVFIISGLWHGAAWSFVVWGAYHGMFLILERLFLFKVYDYIGSFVSRILTFIIVVIGWVFFRVENLSKSIEYIKSMFDFSVMTVNIEESSFLFFALMAIVFSFFTASKFGHKIHDIFYNDVYRFKNSVLVGCVSILLFIISMSYIATNDFNPFIYFRF